MTAADIGPSPSEVCPMTPRLPHWFPEHSLCKATKN